MHYRILDMVMVCPFCKSSGLGESSGMTSAVSEEVVATSLHSIETEALAADLSFTPLVPN